MKKKGKTKDTHEAIDNPQIEDAETRLPIIPIPLPLIRQVSGLYESGLVRSGADIDGEEFESTVFPAPIPIRLYREELRLDVDGHYPQMRASGTIRLSFASRVHWIANLRSTSSNKWAGPITYREGTSSIFPYRSVEIEVRRASIFASPTSAKVTFSGHGTASRVCILRYKSPTFHKVEFEYDAAEGTAPLTAIRTHDHPNRPAGLPNETLTIETVYRRAGFSVSTSPGDTVPISLAGADRRWTDMEMHDAMQMYWSRFANRAQWSMWVFFASLHVQGTSLGGIMFDDVGPNHRQGTALFLDSFIKNAPAGDPNPDAWRRRMIFWTAVHEMGHAFNLAHSWQKSLTVGGRGPWIPLADEPEARSFMNYPYRVAGGQTAFFADFENRFSNQELIFMRHAPERFVQMGNADWFDHHGFRHANISPEPTCSLELRVNRPKARFEFLEPISLELKLKNISSQPKVLPADLLASPENLTLIIKKKGTAARQYIPFAQYCMDKELRTIEAGKAMYDSIFVSVGRDGWYIDEPGNYTVQAVIRLDEEEIVSAPLNLQIAPPEVRDEEVLAQDFFNLDVGRILAFDGSRFLTTGNDTLREIVDRLPGRRVALHGQMALGNALARPCKQLTFKDTDDNLRAAHLAGGAIKELPAQVKEAKRHLKDALTVHMELSAESLGHIDCHYYIDNYSRWLVDNGDNVEARKVLKDLHKVLAARGVLNTVLEEIRDKAETITTARRTVER